MKVFIVCVLIGLAACDKLPTQQSAPYAPSGWKPSGAQLALPLEYGPPQAFRKPDVQVTQERVQFAGQQQISETTTQLSNEYLPPAPTDLPDQVSFWKRLKMVYLKKKKQIVLRRYQRCLLH